MYYKCCVRGCSTRNDAILHRFPTNENRMNLWLRCLNNNELERSSLHNLFVCGKHFEKRFITSSSRLRVDAHPTLFTPEEISTEIPQSRVMSNIHPLVDHNYTRKRHLDHNYCKEESSSGISPIVQRKVLSNIQQNIDQQPSTSRINIAAPRIILGTTVNPENIPSTSSGPSGEQLLVGDVKKIRTVYTSKKRLIRKVNDLAPICQTIYKEYKKAKQQIVMLKRSKRALKFSKEKAFETLCKNMNPYAKKLIEMQIKLCTKNKKGYRFSLQEKLIALSIMKQSPKGYRFLRRIFILPSRSTLNMMVSKLNIQTGICPQVFELVKKEVAEWDEKKKWCSLIFDEMSLETALNYDKKRDSIVGFVELIEKERKYADHALVFMLRGAICKWQQPIAFYYCAGATSGLELKSIIKNVISAVVECGLKPVAVICDQGTAFQSALKSLKDETKRAQILSNQIPDGTVTISGVNLNIIYDPSHLIKGLRNNFLNKNFSMEGRISKWSDIVYVYLTDCSHTEVRLLHKLNDQHVIPEKIKKMKVKNCVKVFSSTMSAALSYTAKFSHYADGRPVSVTIENTAKTVLFLDKLFDSVNGITTFSKRTKGKPLRTAVTESSPHHQFWDEAINTLENTKYLDTTGHEKSVPSLKNFILTLKSYQKLWQFFKKEGITVMRPRYFNSDPIENFFGQVRAYNYRNNDPNCHSFNCTFKSLLITRIIKFHNNSFNCEDDSADQIINLQTLFTDNKTDDMPGHPNTERILEQARRERINVHSRAYTAGWVVRKVLNNLKINCDSCKKCLTTNQQSIHEWLSNREFCQAKKRLIYPSEGAIRCFGTVIKDTNEYLENKAILKIFHVT